jgi:hypothetical protein
MVFRRQFGFKKHYTINKRGEAMRYLRYLTIILALMVAATAFAEDGGLFVRNVSKTPDYETDHATIRVLYKNVPAWTSGGEATTVDYLDKEEAIVETRDHVKPLVSFYHDGPVVHPPDSGAFPGHGNRDVFGAVSLDDGQTWQRSNLSKSGDRSSFRLKDGTDYPGDTFRLFANSAGNKVCVAWASRYARGGNPNYAMTDEDRAALATYLGIEVDDLYLRDMWGVSGSQKSSDFADEDFPTVGEVPYAALWAARGTLEPADSEGNVLPADTTDPVRYVMVWRQAERLTSARRDVHRIEVGVAGGAGFVITWQEDPDGLRPGHGEGPGEGWSGAVAHHETDIWYSWIDWNEFDMVDANDGDDIITPITLEEFLTDNPEGNPSVGVPFSMPVRLTDNAMGVAEPDDYDPIEEPSYLYELDQDGNGIADLCADSVQVEIITPEGPTSTNDLCITEDGRLLRGNTAATRCRVNLRGYDTDGDDIFDEAWVVLAYEESKGLGEEEDMDPNDLIEKVDMGKNIWYHTFDMRYPELVSQGMQLNQPAVYPDDWSIVGDRLSEDASSGYRFMDIDPDPIYEDQAGLETTLYQNEIARRFSLISQPLKDAGSSGTVAFAMWKQGIIRQGGPADVFARRFVAPTISVINPVCYPYVNEDGEPIAECPDGEICDTNPDIDVDACYQYLFDGEPVNECPDGETCEENPDYTPEVQTFDTTVNPFDYSNMVCDTWQFEDGSNPRYVKGLCVSTPINMSGTSLVECERDCAEIFPFNEYFDDIDMSQLADGLQKIYQWSQSGPDYGVDPTTLPTEDNNFDDLSWENPYDVAKGHRGYMSGDYIMMLYCWSPNWLANTVGHDNYNLYVRRSFDGGQTWTTLPDGWTDTQPLPEGVELTADGTVFYEWMGPAGGDTEYKVEYILGPGEFEPVRNMSLLTGTKLTVLDPRYAPTGGATHSSITAEDGTFLYPDDERDPSKWFITFEVGDNTTVAEGEATPLDMYYSRAFNYGDDFEVVENIDADAETDNDYYFDWLEHKKDDHAAEAAMSASPGGMFFWTVWNQWQEDEHENVSDSDAMMRRLIFLDEEPFTEPSGDNPDSGGDVSGGGSSGGGGGGGGGGRPSRSVDSTTTADTDTTTVVVKGKKGRR